MGEYWYFGGEVSANRRQVIRFSTDDPIFNWNIKVSKIDGCQLVRQADMEFDFYIGSCQSFDQPTPKILLCFDYYHTTECHT